MLWGFVVPEYPCSFPLDETTLWQGVKIIIGLFRIACPAAREARGEPARTARSL